MPGVARAALAEELAQLESAPPEPEPIVVPPTESVPTGAAILEAIVPVALGETPLRRCSVCGEPGHTKRRCPRAHAVDLTDLELERLTAPDGSGE